MKFKQLIPFFILFISVSARSQSNIATDSILNEMCKSIETSKEPTDSMKFFSAYAKHFEEWFDKMDGAEQDKLLDYVFFRLQRNCKVFLDMLAKTIEQKGDWEPLDKKPVSSLNKPACNDFNTRARYYYRESNGDTVRVLVEKGLWIEEFIDGTYSKLNFRWIGDCEFELEFISSNNYIRKNLSVKGDKYRYLLLDKANNYYSASATAVGVEEYSKFKIYFK
jgi:hypothetical protein